MFFFFFLLSRTPLLTIYVLRLLWSAPDGAHPTPAPPTHTLTFSAPLWCSRRRREQAAFVLFYLFICFFFGLLFFLLLKQTTPGHKDGPCDLMDHFIYLCFPRGDDTRLTGCWSDARPGCSSLCSPCFVFFHATITPKHNMHFVSRKWSQSLSG